MAEVKKESRVPSQTGLRKSLESSRTKTTSLRASTKQSLKDSGGAKASQNDKRVANLRTSLSVPVYSLVGRAAGSLELPKEVFGGKVNEKLLTQAMRVYLNNRRAHHSNTKTRGEVTGSTRKIYAQKGTGRARHGANTAPIFVGGGVAFGPKYRKVILDLPQKMKKAALLSSLAQKASSGGVLAITGLDKASGKTKEMAQLLKQLNSKFKAQNSKPGSVLIAGDKNYDNVLRGVRNIKRLDFMSADQLNTFEVIAHQSLVLTKEAVEKLLERISSKQKKGAKN